MLRISCFVLFVAACASNNSGGGKDKGGGAKGMAAEQAGQKAGSTAVADENQGTDEGASYEGVTCDSSTEGLAWCDSDTEIAVCAAGEWWLLDCSHPDIGGDFCGDDGTTIDCYAATEF